VPYGIYDLSRNRATVCVGKSADTPEFAVDAIDRWWDTEGKGAYPKADRLLILADAGGSHGAHPRLWKKQLQQHLDDRLGLTVTVCHYPRGCSKYNLIEHRLFSYISINWAGKPLRTFDKILNYSRDTTTSTGLKVMAFFNENPRPCAGCTRSSPEIGRHGPQRGRLSAGYSSGRSPEATPRTSRPPDSTSTLAAALATCAG